MVRPFTLDVAFLPVEVGQRPRSAAVVIDVLRASSSIITLFDRGCASIGVADSVNAARAAAATFAARGQAVPLLCGEVGGLAPYGFDYGNSPSEFAGLDLAGRHVVMATTNGTRALHAAAEAGATLVGALLNANAVVRRALELVAQLDEVLLVCSGRAGRFVLDDAVTAGYLCHVLLSEAKVRGLPVNQSNSAIAAYRLYHSFPNLLAALNESDSARALHSIRLGGDVAYCARASLSKTVPELVASSANTEDPRGLYVL
ncbi:MAG TPA: 2-phosphosulfolactate phosphatase [Chloroflexota bacterium]|nr:2-phosphosulfolactate phosphatase [Chloroflexota bacterium]